MKEKIIISFKILVILMALFIFWIIFNFFTNSNSVIKSPVQEFSVSSMPMMEDALISENNYTAKENGGMIDYSKSSHDYDDIEFSLTEKKIIKNANLNLKVVDTEKAANEISEIAKKQSGEVFSTNFFERVKGQKNGNIVIKIPVDKFNTTVNEIKKLATQIISETTSGQDITEQYTDLQAQLKNKEAEEQSFLKILDQAKETKDVLTVTKELSRVRGEIERLKGKIGLMDSQTDMSTIYVNLSEDVEISPIQNSWRPWQVTKKAFSDLINNLQGFVDGLIRFIIVGIPTLIPFLLLAWILYWTGKKIWKKINK